MDLSKPWSGSCPPTPKSVRGRTRSFEVRGESSVESQHQAFSCAMCPTVDMDQRGREADGGPLFKPNN